MSTTWVRGCVESRFLDHLMGDTRDGPGHIRRVEQHPMGLPIVVYASQRDLLLRLTDGPLKDACRSCSLHAEGTISSRAWRDLGPHRLPLLAQDCGLVPDPNQPQYLFVGSAVGVVRLPRRRTCVSQVGNAGEHAVDEGGRIVGGQFLGQFDGLVDDHHRIDVGGVEQFPVASRMMARSTAGDACGSVPSGARTAPRRPDPGHRPPLDDARACTDGSARRSRR